MYTDPKPIAHFNDRKAEIDTLVFHTSYAKTSDRILQAFNRREVSAHYVMDLEGYITPCVPDEKRAWHAGDSFWRNYGSTLANNDINSRSISIEICGTSMGQLPYNQAQIDSLIEFSQEKIKKYNIPPYRVVGHSDIAPLRKADPGKEFPWKELADNKIGFWYTLANARKFPNMSTRQALNLIGYDTRDDESAQASTYAFMRRFIQHRVIVPENMLDVMEKEVYPDNIEHFMEDRVVNVVARAAAFEVMDIRRHEKQRLFTPKKEFIISPQTTFMFDRNSLSL